MVIGIDYWNRGSRQTSTSVTKIYVCSPDHPVLMINLIAFTPLTRKWLKTGGRTVVPFCNTVLHLIHHNLDTSSRHIAGKSYCGHFFFIAGRFFLLAYSQVVDIAAVLQSFATLFTVLTQHSMRAHTQRLCTQHPIHMHCINCTAYAVKNCMPYKRAQDYCSAIVVQKLALRASAPLKQLTNASFFHTA